MSGARFDLFEKSVVDVTREIQLKVGVSDDGVSLYYPCAAVYRFFGVTDTENASISRLMAEFVDFVRPRLPDLRYETDDTGRVCIYVGSESVRYALKDIDEYEYLAKFIAYFKSDGKKSIEDVISILSRYGDVTCVRADGNDEYNYIVFFSDGKPDDYRYLIDIDDFHAHYHRMTPADFAAVIND